MESTLSKTAFILNGMDSLTHCFPPQWDQHPEPKLSKTELSPQRNRRTVTSVKPTTWTNTLKDLHYLDGTHTLKDLHYLDGTHTLKDCITSMEPTLSKTCITSMEPTLSKTCITSVEPTLSKIALSREWTLKRIGLPWWNQSSNKFFWPQWNWHHSETNTLADIFSDGIASTEPTPLKTSLLQSMELTLLKTWLLQSINGTEKKTNKNVQNDLCFLKLSIKLISH